jgi:hypothetical protein
MDFSANIDAVSTPRLLRLGTKVVLGAVLLAPSIWMLSVIPPLWRDHDAYIQVTYPPGIMTILHFRPLYCFVARIPLYLGYAIECLKAGAPFPTPGFFLHPTLSDSGVFLLLLFQHLALWCSAFYLIALTSRLFLVRLVLAIAWAANPLFYTFAHCVGSETLNMILLLLIGALGLRIVGHLRSVPRKEWLLFGVLLWLCILTRQVNAVLAALMPLAFLLLSAQRLIMIPFNQSQSLRRWRRLRARQDLQKATLAVAVGISCIALANISLRAVCQAVHIPYHSRVGVNFLSRLDFLLTLPAKTRNQLLDKVAKNTASPDVKRVISLLREFFAQTPNWDNLLATYFSEPAFYRKIAPDVKKVISLLRESFSEVPNWDDLLARIASPDGKQVIIQLRLLDWRFNGILTLMQRTQRSLSIPNTELQGEKFKSGTSVSPRGAGKEASLPDVVTNPSLALVLNRTAKAFLYPPDKIFVKAVATDFKRYRESTIPKIVEYLFHSTTFYFVVPSLAAGEAPLFTFRDKSADQIVAIFLKHSYLHLWKSFNYNAFLFFWFANLSLLTVLAKVRKEKVAAVASYAVALTLIGLVMVLANCCLVTFVPRYALPMWELTIVSVSVLFGKTIECLFSRPHRPPARELATS